MVVQWELAISLAEIDAYKQEVNDFLDSNKTTRAAFDAGRNFHRARVDTRPPMISGWPNIDELEDRVRLAKETQDKMRAAEYVKRADVEALRSFRLNLMHFSVFLCVDVEYLRKTVEICSGRQLYDRIRVTEMILANCQCPEFTQPAYLPPRSFLFLFLFSHLFPRSS